MKTEHTPGTRLKLSVLKQNSVEFEKLLNKGMDSTNGQVKSVSTTSSGSYIEYNILFTDILSVWQISNQWSNIISRVSDLEKVNAELIEKSSALLDAMNQYDFYVTGYAGGSASISEVNQAAADQHKAYSELFDLIHKTK